MKLLIVIVGAMLLSLAHGHPTQEHKNAANQLTEPTTAEPRNKHQYFICRIVGTGCVAHTMNEVNIQEKIEEAMKIGSRACGLSYLDSPQGPNKDYHVVRSFSVPGDAFLCRLEYKNGVYVSDLEDLRPRLSRKWVFRANNF